jgi:hypothetical protein
VHTTHTANTHKTHKHQKTISNTNTLRVFTSNVRGIVKNWDSLSQVNLDKYDILLLQGAQAKMANKFFCLKSNVCKQTSQFMKIFVEKRLMLSLNPNLAFKTSN